MFERFTDESRNVVMGAQRAARELQDDHIGTEHLLLAMLDPEAPVGLAFQVLTAAGLAHQSVREEVKRLTAAGRTTLDEDDAAALGTIGIDLEAIRAKIEETFGAGALEAVTIAPGSTGQTSGFGPFGRGKKRRILRFTPRSKKVLQLSLREAIRLKVRSIGSEHLLLGLLREGHGTAAKILIRAGVPLEDLRTRALAAAHPAAPR